MTSPTDGPINISVQNRMMFDHRNASASPQTVFIKTIQLKGGGQNIIVDNGIDAIPGGKLPELYRFYPDPTSLTGWSGQTIPLPGVALMIFTVGYESDGSPRLFVMTLDQQQGGSGASGSIYEIPLAADGIPQVPVKIASLQTAIRAQLCFSPIGPSLFWASIDGNENLTGVFGPALQTPFVALESGTVHPVSLGSGQIEVLSDPAAPQWPHVSLAMTGPGGQIQIAYGQEMATNLTCGVTYLPPVLTDGSGNAVPPTSTSVVTYPGGCRRIFATAGDGVVRILDGRPGASPGELSWDSAWTTIDLGTAGATEPISIQTVEAVCRADGGVTLTFLDSDSIVWISEQAPGDPDGAWSQANQLVALPVNASGLFLDDQGDAGLSYQDNRQFLHTATRDEDGDEEEDWDSSAVDTEDGATFESVSVYRVGAIATDSSGAAIAGLRMQIATDDEVSAFVNGQYVYFSKDSPHIAATDATGAIWIMVDIVGSIVVPTFILTSADSLFEEPITVKPEADAQNYATGAHADTLQKALDDQGNPLLPAGSPYEQIAEKLNQLGSAIAHIYAPQEYRSAKLVVPARAGVRVFQKVEDIAWGRPGPIGCWSMKRVDGRLIFQDHTPESAAAERQALIARIAAERGLDIHDPKFDPNNIFDDFVDAMESVGEGIVNGFIDGVQILIDGVSVAINYVVDGLSRLVTAALDGLSVIMDAVTAVLDFAGAVLGRVVGWLIRAIGWLLGLPDLAAIKNRIKDQIKASVLNIQQNIPDPLTKVATMQATIQQWQSDLSQLVAQYQSSPQGTQSNSTTFGAASSLISAMGLGGSSVSSEVSWIAEKLRSALPDLGTLPSPPDLGVSSYINDALTQIEGIAANITSFLADIVTAIQSWVESVVSLNAANADPILLAFSNHAAGLLQSLYNIVGDIGNILHAPWANPQAMLDWLDESVHITFFSSFYEGLVGNPFSLLDFVALVAAIPYSIVAPDTSKKASQADSDENLFYTIYALMIARGVFTSMAALLQQPYDEPDESNIAKGVDRLGMICDAAVGVLTLTYATGSRSSWLAPAFFDLGIFVKKAILAWANQQQPVPWGTMAGDIISMVFGGIGALLRSLTEGKFDDEVFGYFVIGVAADGGHLLVDRKLIPVSSPEGRFLYAAFQGLLSATQTRLFWNDNHDSFSEARQLASC